MSVLKLAHAWKGHKEDVKKPQRLISSFVRAAEEVVEVIGIYNIKSITS